MAVRHDFFKRNKDIRRYISKWFFYEHVDILPRLVELGLLNYENVSHNDMKQWIVNVLNSKDFFSSTVFHTFCHSYFFQRLYKSSLFFGVRHVGEGARPEASLFFLDKFGIQRIIPNDNYYEMHGLRSNVVTQIQIETTHHLANKTRVEIDRDFEVWESTKIKKHKPH